MSPDTWPERLARLGELVSGTVGDPSDALSLERFGPLQESADAFYAVAVTDQQDDRLTVVTVDWAKEPFETWWAGAAPDRVAGAPRYDTTFSLPTINMTACVEDTWRSVRSLPDARDGHVAVWTGSEMLVWGGLLFADSSQKPGGRYDPATDSWHPINSRNHPLSRVGATAVWTGTELVIWGGWGGADVSNVFDTGGRYDPQTDDWTPTTTVAAPAARTGHTAVWSGSEMIVWGGCTNGSCFGGLLATGGRYDPSTDTWSATRLTDAPTARSRHTAVWSDSEMIVWGGDAGPFSSNVTSTGGRYDPVTDSWTATGTSNAPAARDLHQAVWTGSEMIVWGGCEAGGCFTLNGTGGRYDPVTDAWQPTSNVNAPEGRRFHTAVWTGSTMIVWGGCVDHDCSHHRATGGRYDPGIDAWTATATAGAPQARSRHTAVWSGSEMIVWAGCFGGECQIETDTGGRYDPVSDSWVPTSVETGPSGRLNHTAVWTGSEMIVWGGWDGIVQGNGKRYDPTTDSWTAVQGSGAPFSRDKHTAVWTGTEMVVWGGSVRGIGADNSGGRYDPVTDSWTATSTTGAPSERMNHTAIWTGTEMLVWGGPLVGNTGGRYSPATDSWLATSTAGAPMGRFFHNAVWSGSEMIVWGGRSDNGSEATGGRYTPATDAWSPVGMAGAPSVRQSHVGVWTGSQMVVWGGRNDSVLLDDGGRYDPSTDAWSPTSATDAPDPRYGFTGIWTGDEMIVWGGYVDLPGNDDHFTGGRYDPVADAWTPTGTGAFTPFGRAVHTAVWTGNEMIVWGGWRFGNGSQTNTGAMYCVPLEAACGNGTVEGNEQCDDGNTTDGDGCDSSCRNEVCGNGVVQAGEECDDGNTNDNDGCSNACTINVGANAVVNGDFSAGTAPWVFFTSGDGTYQVVGGEAKLTFTTGALTVIFYQDNLAVDSDTQYTLSFRARHSVAGRKIQAGFVRQTSPFPSYGLPGQTFVMTTTMAPYSVDFTTTSGVITDGRLRINLASAAVPGSMLWIDDVVLTETTPAVCGDGTVDAGEQCDDGNTANGDGCDSNCQIEPPVCGNGIVESGEQCDDGNTTNGDGCSSTCQVESGPNLVINGNFSGGTSPWRYTHSNGSSTFSVVGGEALIDIATPSTNGQLWQSGITLQPNTTYRLTFDARNTGGDNVRARVIRHTSPYTQYGNQVINLTTQTQTYTFTFTTPASVQQARVQFYIGPYDSANDDYYFDNVSLALDSPAVCGNGIVEGAEQCDDGNTANGDGCDSNCQLEPVCGNGTVEAGEECDDGNTANGDGCDSNCQLEPPVCGNGIVEAGEQCDDGNTTNGDGCSSTCQTEGGGGNLLVNGNFSAGTAPWRYSANGSSSFSVVGGEAFVDINVPGTNNQLYQRDIVLQPNTTYRLTFRGRNTGGDNVRVRMIRHTSPYTNYGLDQGANLTPAMQTFTMTFTTPSGPLAAARLQMWIAPYDSAGDDYYFDNFVLEEQ